MSRALLVAGPPHGPRLWDAVEQRLASTLPTRVVSLVLDHPAQPSVSDQARWLADQLTDDSWGSDDGPPVLIAHGLACPTAILAARHVPDCRLVLANGPISRLDPLTRSLAAMARTPSLLASTLFHPAVVVRWLYSSTGLRRAVRNPYVMDRDTVVAICSPLFSTPTVRRALAEHLATLPQAVRSTPGFQGPTLLMWGDEDLLYPPSDVDGARLLLPALQHRAVAGGRQLHPVERPWELADGILEWLAQG